MPDPVVIPGGKTDFAFPPERATPYNRKELSVGAGETEISATM
jgi:hypothetical protein